MRDAPGFDAVKPLREAVTPLRFAGLVLDLDACALARESGEAIPLTRGELALLRMFVARPGRVIGRDALLDAVAKRPMQPFDRSVDVLVGRLRRKIEPDPKGPRLIVTVPGEGYRFDGLRLKPPQVAEPLAFSASTREGAGPPRLSIIVLPFANLGGDPEQEYFADGVTDSLTTDLSRISGTFVIGRSTAFTYKGKTADVRQVGRELNVRYALEGSVQREGNRMRVNVQLLDAETASHIWAERFDKPVADLFEMQDEIVSRLANALGQELARAEAGRAYRTANPDSMDHYFLGEAMAHKGQTVANLARRRFHYDRALALDPENVDALVRRAWVEFGLVASWLCEDRDERLRRVEADLARALRLRPDSATGHCLMGALRIYTDHVVEGVARCERALAIDRNLAAAHGYIGAAKIFSGRSEETEAHILKALRISPRDRRAWSWTDFAGVAKLHLGRDDEAVAWLYRSVEFNPNMPVSRFCLAAALARLDRIEEARKEARTCLELNPSFTIALYRSQTNSRHPVYLAGRERMYQGMRLAGIPEQ